MTSPYRNETEALNERKATIEQELERLRAQTSELEGLRSQQSDLEKELAAIGSRLGARHALPMLDRVEVASPCKANWDDMVGDERVRFCLSCEKNVFNLSAMPRQEAEQLLQDRASGGLCVRFYRRADGTIMTDDCPVGVKRKRRKKLALAVAGAGAMAVAAMNTLAARQCRTMGAVSGEVSMGDPMPVQTAQAVDAPKAPHAMDTAAPSDDPLPVTPKVELHQGQRKR